MEHDDGELRRGDRVRVNPASLSLVVSGQLGSRVREVGTVIGMTYGGAKVVVKFETGRGFPLRRDQVTKVE